MIKFFNTLGHREEEFKPLSNKSVNMYVCGPTVYDYDHLGHARTFIIFDSIKRFLESVGYKVNYVQNITDVGHLTGDTDAGEDKIEKRAKERKTDPFEIARFFESAHFKDMQALNVEKPSKVVRATEHIEDFISFVEDLLKKGNAYEVNGNVYFAIESFPEYGKLSGRKKEELIAGARIEKNPEKKNPLDFALWKKAEPEHLMQWDSPWGKGYPGWHIECSVMSQKYLGETLDIHGGAVELAFPHHENEIAQSEAKTGKPFAKYWLHSGLVTVNGQKMSKSLGNFVTIKDILAKYSSDTIRLAFLKTHWRRPFDWDEKALEEAEILVKKLSINRLKAPENESRFKNSIAEALSDDFNSPKAISIVLENIEKLSKNDFNYICQVFGLKLINEEKQVELTLEQKNLIQEREEARKSKDFARSDEIRKILAEQGIVIEDTPAGPKINRTT